jgi:hypothetical protein
MVYGNIVMVIMIYGDIVGIWYMGSCWIGWDGC